jgi:flagellar hook-associated protein 1 FlgK
MSASTLMSLGTRAMFANFAALQTTGNNIANANTAGYSRQQVELATAPGQYTGAGFFGKGVDILTVTRSYDKFLTTQAASASSTAAADEARMAQLKQLENVFTLGENGLGAATGSLINAFVDVANNPQDSSARQVVITRAKELAARFTTAGNQISSLQSGVTLDMKTSVEIVNGLARQVAQLNKQISSLQGAGHTPNDLLDQRDQLVGQISQYVGVTTVEADDHSMGLFIGGGQALVLGANASTLKATTDTFDPSKSQLSMVEGGVDRLIPESSLSGGSILGLMQFQNEDLVEARNLLGQMATAVAGSLNQQQSLGLDLGQPPAFGSALFSVGAPRAQPSRANGGNAEFGVSVADFTQVQASDYELRFDGANYTLTRLSDDQATAGSPFSPADLAAGVQVEGMIIRLDAGGSAPGDRYKLQPVAAAAEEMKLMLTDPKGIAAASPMTATFNAFNTGTASAATLSAVNNSLDRNLTANINFTSATGDYDWTLTDSNGVIAAGGSAIWSAGAPIELNGFALNLNGVPRSGDAITVSPTVSSAGNNGNALVLSALGEAAVVGASTLPDGTLSVGKSFTDAYASAVSNIGVRVQSATSAAKISSAFAETAETTRANKSGVNLDEEAARLIQFQQSYQASAKVLQVAQSVLDTLLQMAGR